ncbi:MAG: class II aldolase/adducin family protein [Pseudomonadota bacterium]
MPKSSLYQDLQRVSAALGRDPLLVQGSGGNTSVKALGRLLAKSSGRWLRDAQDTDIFMTLDLFEARRLAMAGADYLGSAVTGAGAHRVPPGTAIHALMPDRCVIEVRPVSIIARTLIGAPCGDLAVLPYLHPGQAMVSAVTALLAQGRHKAIVVANHALLVGGRHPDHAAQRLKWLCKTLYLPLQAPPSPHGAPPSVAGYTALHHPLAAAAACDETAVAALSSGPLVPDQFDHLAGGAAFAPTLYSVPRVIAAFGEAAGALPGLIVLKGHGLYLRDGLGAGAYALADFLVELSLRIPKGRQVCPLSPKHTAGLTSGPREPVDPSVNLARIA